jgi:hypothetical protein
MKRVALIWGSILGVLLSINLIYTVYLCYNDPNFKPNMVLGYLVILVMLSMVFFGIKNYRDKQLNGIISLGQAFKTGALIALVGATIYVIVWLVTYYLYVPDFMDKYAQHELRNAISSGMPLIKIAKIKQATETYKELYKNPFWVVVLTYLEVLPLGLVVAFISALVLRRKSDK